MIKSTIKGCFSAMLALGCLMLIAIIIVILILLRNFKQNKPLFYFNNDLELASLEETDSKVVQNTHLYPKNKSVSLRILLISDTEDFWDNTKKALEAGKGEEIDFAIHTGDVTLLGVPEMLQSAKEIFDNSGLTIYPIPGDRDLWKSRQTKDGLAAFNEVFGDSYRIINVEGYNFLLLDNSNIYEGIDDKQWEFIQNNIKDADFVFLHNPVYFNDSYLFGEKGMGQYSEEVANQREELMLLIRESPVKAVFAGNQHLFSETVDATKKDLTHYVVGSLNPERNLELPNFAIMTIYEDGDYYVKKVTL